MSVPRLEDIVLTKTVHWQWLESELPALALRAMQTSWSSSCKLVTNEIVNTINKYMKSLSMQHLPSYLKQRWAFTFHGLAMEAVAFLVKLNKNSRSRFEFDKRIFVDQLVFTQNCEIDTAKTIFAIQELTEFEMRYDKKFMFDHIFKDDMLNLIAKAQADKDSKPVYRTLNISKKNPCDSVSDFTDIKEVCRIALQNKQTYNLTLNLGLHEPKTAVCSKIPKLLKYWLQVSRPSEDVVVLYAHNLFKNNNNVAPEIAIILLEYLGSGKFFEATKEEYNKVLKSLQGSWRSRHHYVQYWRLLAGCGALSPAACRTALAALPPLVQGYAHCQLSYLLKHVWENTPQHLKYDRLVYNYIACMIKDTNFNQQIMNLLLKDYDSVRVNAILLSMIKLKEVLKCNPVNTLTNLVDFIRKMFGNQPDIFLTRRQLKKLLLMKCDNFSNKVVLNSLLALSRVDGARFRASLVSDVDFIKDFLSKNWGNSRILEFFEWLVGSDSVAAARFVQRVARVSVQPVFEQRLARGCARLAAAGLAALRLPLHKALKHALYHKTIQAQILTKMLDDAGTFRYYKPEDWELFVTDRTMMKTMFISSIGRQKILEMLTRSMMNKREPPRPNIYDEAHYRTLEQFRNIIDRLLAPSELCASVDLFLEEFGHPNANPEFDHLRDEDRVDIDFKYRCFRALLNTTVVLPRPAMEPEPEDLTLVSIRLAEAANLAVPVVM